MNGSKSASDFLYCSFEYCYLVHLYDAKMLLPVIVTGIFSPKSASIVGATSTSEGLLARMGRLLKITPGTSETSAQWSALQAESLSDSTSLVIFPKQVVHEAR